MLGDTYVAHSQPSSNLHFLVLYMLQSSTSPDGLQGHACLPGMLVGDVLLAAAFVSYAGPFTMPFRKQLVHEKWMPDLQGHGIPTTAGITPMKILADEAMKVIAQTHTNQDSPLGSTTQSNLL